MQKFVSIVCLACLLVLSACGEEEVVVEAQPSPITGATQYRLGITIADDTLKTELDNAIERTIKRRLDAIGEAPENVIAIVQDGKLVVSAANQASLVRLEEQITRPFSLQFMEPAPIDEADVIVADIHGFKATDLSHEHIAWMNWDSGDITTNQGRVIVKFTEAGLEKKRELFAGHVDKNLGLFIHEQPIYQFTVQEADIEDDTFEMKIPYAELAEIFADDMNVSLNVTFTPT